MQAPTRRLVVDGRSVTVVRGPIVGAGGGVSDHGALTGRDAADSHPLAAVTGLTDALAGKTAGGEVLMAFSAHPGALPAGPPWEGMTVLVAGDPAGLYVVDAAGTLVMSRSAADMAGEVWSAQAVDPLTAPRVGAAFVAVDLTAFGGGAGLVEVGAGTDLASILDAAAVLPPRLPGNTIDLFPVENPAVEWDAGAGAAVLARVESAGVAFTAGEVLFQESTDPAVAGGWGGAPPPTPGSAGARPTSIPRGGGGRLRPTTVVKLARGHLDGVDAGFDGQLLGVMVDPLVDGGIPQHLGYLTASTVVSSDGSIVVVREQDPVFGERRRVDLGVDEAWLAGQIAAVAPSSPTRTLLAAGPVVAGTTTQSSLLSSPIVLPTIGTNGEADIDLAFDLRCNVSAASMLLTLVVGGVTVWVSGSSPQPIAQSVTGRHAGPIRVRLWRDSASQTTWDVSSMVTLSTTGVSSIRSSAGVAAIDVSGATVDLRVTLGVASALLTAQTVRGVVTVWQP